jgi:hypothetical protein
MRQENDEIHQSKTIEEKIAISSLKMAFGVNERQIAAALKAAYDQYSKYFTSLESKEQYQSAKEKRRIEREQPLGTVPREYAKDSEDGLLQSLILIIYRVKDLSKIPAQDALSSVRKELDTSFAETKKGDEVLKKLSSIKVFTMISIVKSFQTVVAKSDPADIIKNREQGKDELFKLKEEQMNKRKGASPEKSTIIQEANALSDSLLYKAELNTSKSFDIKRRLNEVNGPIETYLNFVSDEKRFSALTTDEKEAFIYRMKEILKPMQKQLELINKNEALDSFRDESPEFAKYQQLASQLQEKANNYSDIMQKSQKQDSISDKEGAAWTKI